MFEYNTMCIRMYVPEPRGSSEVQRFFWLSFVEQVNLCIPVHCSNCCVWGHCLNTSCLRVGGSMGGDLAPSLGDAKKFSRTFMEKISIFTPKNSDDQVFLILTLSFQILCVFIVSNVIYDPFFTTKSPLSTKKFLDDTYFFTLFKLSRPSHNTTSQNIWGTNAWAVPPPQILGGPSPQSPLGLCPGWVGPTKT